MDQSTDLDARLLNDWQQRFPLDSKPFETLARQLGCGEGEVVLARLRRLQAGGSISRIGGIWNPGAGGAALLCAMAVPPQRLDAVAALVSAHPGVNHNYEREHAYNLWFVLTGHDNEALEQALHELERRSGLHVLRLPMQRAYRINLGFDLQQPGRGGCASRVEGLTRSRAEPVASADMGLAALVEDGLPLLQRPYAAWAEALGWPEEQVLQRLQQWLDQGTLRRFGVVVRHHELGISANAMCVFDVADEAVDEHAALLARQPGVTLCYRRARGPGWPYNLYCMLHGRERDEVLHWLACARSNAGLENCSQAVLFSRRRFKQCGARYFRAIAAGQGGSNLEASFSHA
ncbi:siroheme decarboxylase subunit beta [Paucibacter soli]|uniref:siroheme decarboxylase subunit beta n=1 Tax=Paucibacter soli TaxID=3133433 RepID=UPI0030AABEF2